MKFEEDAIILPIDLDEPTSLRPSPKRRGSGLGRCLVRGLFLLVHLAMIATFLAWADGRLPRLAVDRDEATQNPAVATRLATTPKAPPGD